MIIIENCHFSWSMYVKAAASKLQKEKGNIFSLYLFPFTYEYLLQIASAVFTITLPKNSTPYPSFCNVMYLSVLPWTSKTILHICVSNG